MVEDIDFLNHGSIEIRDGGNLTFVTSTLENFGTVMGNGELQLVGGTLINHGTIAPGLSPGTLKINGNFQNALDGVIELEIASASVYDVLEFSPGPTLALGGTLRYPAFIEHLAARERTLPRHVQREFEDYLKCGRLEHGFLRVRCADCHAERLVAFSCKRRGYAE